MKVFHSRELIARPPKPVRYIVEVLLPESLVPCDISGPPGAGKSTIVLSMVEHISTGKKWFGRNVQQRAVAWISGEASDEDAITRDLLRLQADPESDITVIFPERELFRWNKKEGRWEVTEEGEKVLEYCKSRGIGLVVIDTCGSVCAGLVEIDNDQQRQLARMLRRVVGLPCITISHTNQSSAKEPLPWRLHYQSRAGGNGFPGAIRWAAGVSILQSQDAQELGGRITKEEIEQSRLVAFGASKYNEIPCPKDCNNHNPMIFEITPTGELTLVAEGGAVAACKAQKAYAAASTKGYSSRKAIDVSEVRDDDF